MNMGSFESFSNDGLQTPSLSVCTSILRLFSCGLDLRYFLIPIDFVVVLLPSKDSPSDMVMRGFSHEAEMALSLVEAEM